MTAATGRILALAVPCVALLTVPFWMPGIYYINVSSQILFYAIFALGLNILVGYGGLVSLGHAGLFGTTAYAVAYLLQPGFGHTSAIIAALVISLFSTAIFAALALRATGIGFIMISFVEVSFSSGMLMIALWFAHSHVAFSFPERREQDCRTRDACSALTKLVETATAVPTAREVQKYFSVMA